MVSVLMIYTVNLFVCINIINLSYASAQSTFLLFVFFVICFDAQCILGATCDKFILFGNKFLKFFFLHSELFWRSVFGTSTDIVLNENGEEEEEVSACLEHNAFFVY